MTTFRIEHEPTAEATAAWLALREALLENGPPACADDPREWDVVEVEVARRVCGRCPVRQLCVVYARAANERHLIWGGHDFGERIPATKRKSA